MSANDTPSIDRSPSERADVCVVGAGPAGGLLSHSLAKRGHDVVVLEAGPRFDLQSRIRRMERSLRPAHDRSDVWDMGGARDAFTSSGSVSYPLNDTRVKGVGGTTLHWIGYTPRLHPKDFEMDSRYGLGVDWPLDYEDVRPYYADVEAEMGVSGGTDNPFAPPREEAFPMDAFPPSYSDTLFEEACDELDITLHSVPQARNHESYDGRSGCVGYGTCMPVCPSGAKYSGDVHIRKAESEGARVLDRVPVQRLEHDDAGETVEAAVYATPDGTEHRQEARQFVIACGAVETPRLLLLSESEQYPNGLANTSDAVGRYFMEHALVGMGGRLDQPTKQHRVGFTTSVTHQFYDHEEPTPGSFFVGLLNYAGPTTVGAALSDGSWGDELASTLATRVGGYVGTEALVEQLPREDSRVTLDTSKTDDHGNPVPDVSWKIGEHAVETARKALDVQRDIMDELGVTVTYAANPTQPWAGSHPMGTTRMGTDPSESVVDERLRTHDLSNLSIASSSVFPTGGAMNPTVTIGALSLKAADHIHADL
ncbi:GMC family oxidoreductase [Halarchaeum grantii]|uniref:GMC family oxidoreductase n=1 Tax=Halarchaeum grantii TaxID=1193105 RepID=A0A830FBK6_9EURY|nr:GMC family oxidoreductase [Halarchaeum grantii]GGL38478.1 GMC family oxidoreductase [Halarchaeum grantii]